MTSPEFIASVIDSLAWPCAVVWIVYLFRNRLSELIPRIEEVEYKDFKARLSDVSKDLPGEGREAKTLDLIAPDSKAQKLAELSPRAGVLESWIELEGAIANRIARDTNEKEGAMSAVPPHRMAEYLVKKGVLNRNQLEAFNALRNLRNKVLHLSDTVLQVEDAHDYIRLAEYLKLQVSAGT